jgi:coenzyme F420-reducing hydrogenase beta subunit
MIEKLQEETKKLLKEKKVNIVIGYEKISSYTTPCFIENEDEVEKLIFNEYCVYNLSLYLPKFLKSKTKPIAIVAKGCDVKSIIVLVQEHQIMREDIIIIGVECNGVKSFENKNIMEKCKMCDVHIPKIYDILIRRPGETNAKETVSQNEEIDELEGKTIEERWNYWKKEFDKCIRCYACRQICPLCYCYECIVDCNLPGWVSPYSSLNGNTVWNVIRAYHLAGRCTGCGECERVCPVKIPLMKLNKKMSKEIKELFNYTAGEKFDVKPPLDDFSKEDREDFIK